MSAGMSEIEIRCERDVDIMSMKKLVRIRYREHDARRWSKLLVVVDDSTYNGKPATFGDVMNNAHLFVEAAREGKA